MRLFLLAITAATLLTGCAVDYTTKNGDKFRFSLTATPEEVKDALEGFRK